MAAAFDRLAELRSLYAVTRDSIDVADPEKRAPLIARAESIAKQIADLAPPEKAGDPIDEIAARRVARGGATSRLGHSARSQG